MNKNQSTDDVTLSLLPAHLKDLYDEDAKIGTIRFTKEQKLELTKFVGSPIWDLLKQVYVKQRLVQIAVANINISQETNQLQYYKGKAAEVDHLFKVVKDVADQFKKEEKASKQSSK